MINILGRLQEFMQPFYFVIIMSAFDLFKLQDNKTEVHSSYFKRN